MKNKKKTTFKKKKKFFLAQFMFHQKYCLLFVDPFTSKIYMYLMKNSNLLKKKKTEHFNNDISKTRGSNQKMRIQADQKFQENKIKKLN